jgi:hypothetical protein
MKCVENITKLGQFSEPGEFHLAHLFPFVWKRILLLLLLLYRAFHNVLRDYKHL